MASRFSLRLTGTQYPGAAEKVAGDAEPDHPTSEQAEPRTVSPFLSPFLRVSVHSHLPVKPAPGP